MKLFTILSFAMLGLFLASCSKVSEKDMKMAYRHAKEGEWKKTEAIVTRRINEVPADMEARVLLSLAIFNLYPQDAEAMTSAMENVRQAVLAEEQRYDFWLVYGWLLLNTGKAELALEPLQKAYDLHLDSNANIGQETQGIIKYALGKCCAQNRKFLEADKFLTQALKSTPFSTWVGLYNDVAVLSALHKDYPRAYSIIKSAIAVSKLEAKKGTPYPYLECLYLNAGVLCDMMRQPKYGKNMAPAYKKAAIDCYRTARHLYEAKLKLEQNAAQKQAIGNNIALLDARLADLAN